MYTNRAIYQQRQLHSSRIEMLLDLLHATQQCLEQTVQVSRGHQAGEAFRLRSRALALLGGLQSGVEPNGSEVTQKISQLYEYVQHCLVEGDERLLVSALSVLQRLTEGFEGIREEAHRLEQTGAVPPVVSAPILDTSC